jgi:cytochrome P450/NADPH-cytochrome P450 reductase
VVENRELVDLDAGRNLDRTPRSKRHVEIALPAGSTYRAGDYLAVLPLNPAAAVDRALARFGLAYDEQAVVRIGEGGRTFLPTGTPVAVGELLASYVELSQPATRRQVEQLAAATVCPPDRAALGALAEPDRYRAEVLDRRTTVLDLLERFPASQLAFASYLAMLAPLTPRRYSISSSPRWSPDHATVTVAVVSEPALSGQGVYEGAASTYLAHARPGTKVAVTVRPSNVAFHPPALSTPTVMVCAGSGIAPFRGFVQDRALQARAEGVTPAPALLFFGCTAPEVDELYRDELAEWAVEGVVDVRPAYSQGRSGQQGQHVQDRLWADRADVVDLVRRGATFYVCGDGRRMAPAVHDACVRIYREATGASEEDAEAWMTAMEREHARYVADVFA